jgi:hypothetical protein
MCFAIYIGTEKELELGKFVPEQTDIYFENLTDEEEEHLRPKFCKTNIYYVGSDTGCSCGLVFESEKFDDPDEQSNKKSPQRFIDLLMELTLTENIEYYCCWEGDWNLPTELKREIDIREISLDKNYFVGTEKEFINFRQQKTDE